MNSLLVFNLDKTIILDSGDEIITFEYASFGARLGARLIDCIILIIPGSLIPLIFPWLYYSLQQSGDKQATVGQNTMEILVLSEDGSKITFGQATGRFFGNILNVLTLFIGFLLYFSSEKKQCLHDQISGCIVVKVVKRESKINK